jgi:uncharacterized protein with HEPN domain
MSKRDDLVFIKHILDAINDIEESINGLSKQEFIDDKDIKDATIRRIEIIGEAVKNISPNTKNKYPGIEWKQIAGTRDKMIHHYFSVDLDITWGIIKKDIPELRNQILKIEKDLEGKNKV